MADKPITREEKYLAYLTGDYTGEIPKPITRKEKYLYELCLKGIGGEISPEEIKNAVNEYLENNPVKPGATAEQAQQIEQNKTDISSLKVETSSLKEDLGEFHDSYSEFVNADITIQNGYMDSSGNLTENASYKSAKVYPTTHRTYRAKGYMLGQLKWAVAYFCDSSGNVIGNTGIITESTQYDLVFTVPYNATYFVVNSRYEPDDINKNLSLQVRVNKEYAELNDFNELKNDVEDIESTCYEFVDAGAEIKNGYIQYNGQFIPNDSYECSMLTIDKYRDYKVSCLIIKESHMPIAYFFDENMKNIGNSGIVTATTTFTMEEIIVPTNAKYMSITGYISTGVHLEIYVRKPTTLYFKEEITNLKKLPLYGKNAIFLGDSITAQTPTSWRKTFIEKTGVNQVLCTAVYGAHLCDYKDTILDGTTFTGYGNTICNQVQRILNNPPTENIDIIMICAGTNDTGHELTELDGSVTQFINTSNQYIDVDTLDRTRFDGAMRWIAEKLWGLYPNANIFFATPIQGAQGIRASWYQLKLNSYITKVCQYLATPVINATAESGIYGRFENENANGKYLADGLHPNEDGKVKLGTYYASKVINYFSSK